MSLTVFMAICILGCDFMLYVLFQWLYGEKHRKHVRKSPAESKAVQMQESLPRLVKQGKNGMEREERRKVRFAGYPQAAQILVK